VATAEVQQIQFALAIADGMRKNTQEMKDNIVEFMCCFCNYFLQPFDAVYAAKSLRAAKTKGKQRGSSLTFDLGQEPSCGSNHP